MPPVNDRLANIDEILAPLERAAGGGADLLSDQRLDNVAFFDFAAYEYVFPTEHGFADGGLSVAALQTLDAWEVQAGAQGTTILSDLLVRLERAVRETVERHRRPHWDGDTIVDDMLGAFYAAFPSTVVDLLAAYATEIAAGIADLFLSDFALTVRDFVYTRLTANYPDYSGMWLAWPGHIQQWYQLWHEWVNHDPKLDLPDWAGEGPVSIAENHRREVAARPPDDGYPFEVFPAGSINVGLRLIYRQEWMPLGTQRGEIVRTLPLTAGEAVKVTTKIVRREKSTSMLETVSASETTTESTDTSKDSSEIVSEAADTFNWHVDTKASASFFFASAELSAGVGGSTEEKTRSTSAALSESMRKAASRIRRETKQVISTERDQGFDREDYSEITNKNNELAVTYIYYKLQQQYEVFTTLAEVQSVIYVAETMPAPHEIDADWVRRHDWIIAKVLKDESYRVTLNELIQDVDDVDPLGNLDPTSVSDPFYSMRLSAQNQFASFSTDGSTPGQAGQAGLVVPDIYAEPQRQYQERLRELAARARTNRIRAIKRQRLFRHLRDHILHYCRAIWAHEDADQRILRYKKEGWRVPSEWSSPVGFVSIAGANRSEFNFQPTGRTAPLWRVIDPTGPLGYIGNYAVFGLRPLPNYDGDSYAPTALAGELTTGLTAIIDAFNQGRRLIDLGQMLMEMRAPYVQDGALVDPALRRAIADAQAHARLDRAQLEDLLSYLPRLEARYLDAAGEPDPALVTAATPVTAAEWGEYVWRKNATRRFLVDSNNLALDLVVGETSALEPYKRVSRLFDALEGEQRVRAAQLKNERRATHLADPAVFDPDIAKLVVVDANGVAVAVDGAPPGGPVVP